ncbi:titin homolog [Lingula anatina]|uniref:Titin homolog n=1 Tax=Lingula anatina TaxID=7574 RepID=A0A1S3I0X2_LINAN|nr:titin homolog [Lingula anatina]|eukprot:XP_013391908.1 titin homolog [Lingula anatina]
MKKPWRRNLTQLIYNGLKDIENLVNDNSNQIVIVKGAKPAPPEVAPSEQSTMQPSSGEDQSAGWPDINEQDLKKSSGKGSAASSKMSAASLSKLPAAAPAPSVDMLPSAGKGEFSKAPVLPPIQAGLTAQGPGVVPHVHIEPPTPQQSILASREQTNLTRTASQMTNSRLEEHDEEDEGLEDQEEQEQWATHVDEEEIMKKANEKSAEKKSRVPLSARSSRSKGPMAAGGPHLHSSAESLSASLNSLDDLPRVHSARSGFKASPLGSVTGKSVSSKKSIGSAQSYASHRSHKSTKSDDSHKGSVVLLNGGALSIGGAVIMKPKDSEEHLAVEVGGGDGRDSGHHSEEEEAPLHASGHARARAAPAARTKETTQQESKVTEGSSDVERQYGKYRAVDFHGGDFDATASMYTWSYNPQGESVSKFGTSVRSSTIITGHTADSVSEGLPASEYSVPPAKSSNTPAVFLEPEIRVQKSLSPGSSLGHSDVLTGLEADNQSHSHTSEAEAAAAVTESQQEAEKKLIEALTAHARAIAVSVLNKSDAGQDLEEDARLAAELWMERLPTPTQIISRSQSLKDVSYLDYEHDHDEDEAVMEIVKRRMKSAEPTAAEYRDLLRETLASVVTKGTGSPSVHSVDEVSPELIEALANKEDIRPEDLEIIQNEEGKSVIRSRTHSQSHSQSKTQSRSQSQTHSRGLSHGHSEARKGTGRSEVSQHSSHVSQSRRSSGSAVRSAVDTLERKASGQEDGHVMPEASAADQMEDVDAQVASMDLIPYAPLPPIATADDSSAQPSLPPDGSGESFKPSAPGSPAKSSKSAKSGKSAKSVKFVENVKEEKPDPVKGKKKASAKKAGETLVVTVTDDVEPELSKEEADKKVLAEVAQELAQADAKSTKSAKSDKSSKSAKSGKSAKSAKSGASKKSKTPDDKKISEKEFVVGKVENKKELEELYAQPEDPAAKENNKKPIVKKELTQEKLAEKAAAAEALADRFLSQYDLSETKTGDAKKPKKPSVPVVSKAKKTAPKGKKKKEAAPAKKSKAKKKVEEADEDEPPKTLTPTTVMEVKAEEGEKQSGTESPTPSHTTTESSMSFIIVRDEFEATPEPEEKSETKSRVLSSIHTEKTEEEEEGGSETESVQLKNVTDKAARERKRQADRERRKQEVERKRKEREEQIRKEKEAQEAKEKLWKEMEEERRRKEEEIRLRKEQAEEEERLAEEREKEAEKRRLAEMDREKRMKEEYVRKLEEMRKKQKLEEEKRKELERQRQEEEERLRLEEEAMLATMAEAEREEYERKKKEEAELRAKREEEER